MLKLTPDERKDIKGGNTKLLLAKLEELDKALVHKLKTQRDSHDVRYYQGTSHIVDALIEILK